MLHIGRIKISQTLLFLVVAMLIPVLDLLLPSFLHITNLMRPIFIFAILGLGLNIVTGLTGLLHLGVAGFMAIGAYTYSILSCDVYPFQFGFWGSLIMAAIVSGLSGVILGLPTIRLRGDYLAIVTLGFGEIIQDLLRNMEIITKGTQGISPLPAPTIFGYSFSTTQDLPLYYLFLGLLGLIVLFVRNVEHSRIGRSWIAIREDELAASCMGVNTTNSKLLAFATGSAIAGIAGALWAVNLGSSGEPGNYDFQISMIALCIVIIGGMGNIPGVLLGAVLMIGLNSIVLSKLSDALMRSGFINTSSVFLSPNNWKYMIFGFALIFTMRFRPQGLLPACDMDHRIDHGMSDKNVRNFGKG